MVSSALSLTGNGLKDWLIQRVTAVYFALYCVFVLFYLYLHPHLNYEQWFSLFHNIFFSIASLLALLALSLHAWIGIWTVTTDYIKSSALSISLQILVICWLLAQFIWAGIIVWGI